MQLEDLKPWETNKAIWTFWDGPEKPAFLEMCHETHVKNGGLPVIELDEEKAIELIGGKPIGYDNLREWCHKTDFLRVALLYKYGGIWIDYDTAVINPMDHLLDDVTKDNVLMIPATCVEITNEWEITNSIMISPAKSPPITNIYLRMLNLLHKLLNEDGDWQAFVREVYHEYVHNRRDVRIMNPFFNRLTYSDPGHQRPGWKLSEPAGFDLLEFPKHFSSSAYAYELGNTYLNRGSIHVAPYNMDNFGKMTREEILDLPTAVGWLFRYALADGTQSLEYLGLRDDG